MTRALLLAALLLLLTACFEDPVAEQMEVNIHDDGTADVKLVVRISERTIKEKEPTALGRRLENERSAILAGSDDWSRRFAGVSPERETLLFERNRGVLVRAERRARLSFDQLESLFSQSGITLQFHRGGTTDQSTTELAIHTGRNPDASREDERVVRAALDSWSHSLTIYLAALADFYSYLDRHPARGVPMFAKLFESVMEKSSRKPNLSEAEQELTERVDTAINDLTSVFSPGAGESETVEERSARVYDPFPAGLTIRVAGRVVQRDGFAGSGQELLVKRLSFWSAAVALEGRFASPDPFVTMIGIHRTPGDLRQKFNVEQYSQRPRRVNVVDASEVKKAIEEKLRPVPYYQARWLSSATSPRP